MEQSVIDTYSPGVHFTHHLPGKAPIFRKDIQRQGVFPLFVVRQSCFQIRKGKNRQNRAKNFFRHHRKIPGRIVHDYRFDLLGLPVKKIFRAASSLRAQ